MNNAVSRLSEYLERKKISFFRAETECGLSNGLLGKASKSGASLRVSSLEKILNVYTDLSAEWLLRGTGPMIIGEGKRSELEAKIAELGGEQRKDEVCDIAMSMLDMMERSYRLFREGRDE